MTLIPQLDYRFTIGISGAHSTGKTEILRILKDYGYEVDESPSLSRTAQANLGFDNLADAVADLDKAWALQVEILRLLRLRDVNHLGRDKPILVDRSPADLYAYATVWRETFKTDSAEWKFNAEYNQYVNDCLKHTRERYCGIVYRHINVNKPFVPEPGRATLENRDDTDRNIARFVNALYTSNRTAPVVVTADVPIFDSYSLSGSLEEEAEDIHEWIESLGFRRS